jgi:5-methylcytosine-specific restriction protein A
MPKRQCLVCGALSNQTRCSAHQLLDMRPPPAARGYDSDWRRLSKLARTLQPWCSDCGSLTDLTADHLRWPATSLDDVDVVCRACNSRRGARRSTRGTTPDETARLRTLAIPTGTDLLGWIR